jgi:hypothetical protein
VPPAPSVRRRPRRRDVADRSAGRAADVADRTAGTVGHAAYGTADVANRAAGTVGHAAHGTADVADRTAHAVAHRAGCAGGVGGGHRGRGRGTGAGRRAALIRVRVLGELSVLRRRRVGATADVLVDRAVLLGDADGLRALAEEVRARRGLDRGGDVEVRGGREVDGRREVEPEIDVRVDVEQRHDLLVRQRRGALRLDLVHRYLLEVLVYTLNLIAHGVAPVSSVDIPWALSPRNAADQTVRRQARLTPGGRFRRRWTSVSSARSPRRCPSAPRDGQAPRGECRVRGRRDDRGGRPGRLGLGPSGRLRGPAARRALLGPKRSPDRSALSCRTGRSSTAQG